MAATFVRVARWVSVPVVAMVGVLLTQAFVFLALDAVVCSAMGRCGGTATWAIKTVTSVFMGAAFVSLARWAAPRAKTPTSLAALSVVLLWGGGLIASAFHGGFFVWLLAMGLAGIVGGALAAGFGHWRAARRRNVPQQTAPVGKRRGEGSLARTSFSPACG